MDYLDLNGCRLDGPKLRLLPLLFALLVPLKAVPVPGQTNVWIAWANRTGQTDFCLSLATATEPFKTCLIGYPHLDSSDFLGWIDNSKSCNGIDVASQSACLIMQLNHTLPWDPQQLDLLGSEAIDNGTHENTTRTCISFGNFNKFTVQAMHMARWLGKSSRIGWDDNPFINGASGTIVSPYSTSFDINHYCGKFNKTTTLGAYGWSMNNANEILKVKGSAKALPPGIFLICGDRAWGGIPKNPLGGPCYIGKLALLTLTHRNWLKILRSSPRSKRSIAQLSQNCDDNVELWSVTTRIFASMFPSVGTARALNQLNKLACWSVKQARATSEVLEEMMQDMSSLRHAVLQNRAAIDFLLLAQGHGCEDVEGMCCFNLSDHSQSIHKQIDWLKKHTQKIQQESNWFDGVLQSIFGGITPWLMSLIKEALRWLGILILICIIVKIAYGCMMKGVSKLTHQALLAQKEKGGIVGSWLAEKGHGPVEKLCQQSSV
ncbi:uncharacterized protein LOC126035290 isoform X1 [Accipiter gentilis]|uniref:uncharacterized protein LOC126035290 isoform X1 n=1 Tax=Astur gentilis TaxID=8957 RepID=UPI002110AA50|nr:uncharacterized protein LOC126035290 isoform X1 [Accipiter gentilis]